MNVDERPLVLIWEVTQACGLTCKHCRADAQPERHPDELTTAEGKRLLDQAREFGEGQLVVLSGGDPLVREDVIELVEYGTERGLGMTLTPSGTASLTAERVQALADAGLKRMALSIDGGDATAHDGFRGEDGSFEATLAAAEYAREADLPLQINTTVCAETVEQLPAIRELVADLGAVMWSVFFLVPVGRGRVLTPISAERAESVMEWLHEVSQSAPFGLKTTEAPHYRRVAMQAGDGPGAGAGPASGGGGPPSGGAGPPTGGGGPPASADGGPGSGSAGPAQGPPPDVDASGGDGSGGSGGPPADGEDGGKPSGITRRTGIRAGQGFAFVSHTGEVYPSGFLPESAGNVREDSVVDIYRHADLFERLRDVDALTGKCGACPYRGVCGGSRSRAYATTGDPLASDPLCPYVPAGYDGPLPERERGPLPDRDTAGPSLQS